MNRISLIAPAKVNLFLDIGHVRKDGFHEMETVMQKISLCDRIEIELPSSGDGNIVIECDRDDVPTDSSNTVWKAADLFFRHSGLPNNGCRIKIEKNIPAQGGLGGGSSDAAAVLKGLNHLMNRALTEQKLLELGALIGSDVPFFVNEDTTALCVGRGELIERQIESRKLDYILVFPKFGVSTAKAYGLADAAAQDKDKPKIKELERVLCEKNISITHLCQHLYNRFESVLDCEYPEIGSLKRTLLENGCPGALLSGSGSTVFGIVPKASDAEPVIDNLLKLGFQARLVSTLSRPLTYKHENSEGSKRHGDYRNKSASEG